MEPEEPCPWYVKAMKSGRLVDLYCEVGPAGHKGSHIGELSYIEHLARRRAWRIAQDQERKSVGS